MNGIVRLCITMLSILATIPAFALLDGLNLKQNHSNGSSMVLGIQNTSINEFDKARALAIYSGEKLVHLKEFSFNEESNSFSYVLDLDNSQSKKLIYFSPIDEDVDVKLEVPQSLSAQGVKLEYLSKKLLFDDQFYITEYALNYDFQKKIQTFDVKITLVRQD